MIYNNLIYFLIVILLLSTNSVPAAPRIPLQYGALLFLLKGVLFERLVRNSYVRTKIKQGAQYFKAEQRNSILAISLFAVDVYLLDCQYYLARLPAVDTLPMLVSLGGLLLFTGYLTVIWLEAGKSYGEVFGRTYPPAVFVLHNIKINLPIILPWLLLSLISDLLRASELEMVQKLFSSSWGEPLLFLLFFLLLALFFPVLIVRLWGCTSMPAGEMRQRIEEFCRSQRLKYADILIWPLFEGQMLTAGIMGLTRQFRYLLVTPALLQTMNDEEIKAVMAHEIGHVKRYHLQLYLLIFIGFAVLSQFASQPLIFLLLDSDIFYRALKLSGKEPGDALLLFSALPMIVLMVLYFRFFFGFFMRNFERQADLYVFSAMPDITPLTRVLEKIAWLTGNIRDLPNWHHFSIGQRVSFLQQCQKNPQLITNHNRKVYTALALALLLFGGVIFLTSRIEAHLLAKPPNKHLEALIYDQQEKFIAEKIRRQPWNHLWYRQLGDLQYSRERPFAAIKAYEKSLVLNPEDPETLNNLAWALLTVPEPGQQQPIRALALAKKAVTISPSGHVLDTLALAFWTIGRTQEAVEAEQQALAADPSNREYYLQQLKKFSAAQPPSPLSP